MLGVAGSGGVSLAEDDHQAAAARSVGRAGVGYYLMVTIRQ
jgi:hypothetical protein